MRLRDNGVGLGSIIDNVLGQSKINGGMPIISFRMEPLLDDGPIRLSLCKLFESWGLFVKGNIR